MPGLIWLVAGVCLAGAVQDMLVLAASVRRDGKSLAEIARTELGPTAATVVSAAILFIVVIALAGLGIVVVKALGGENVPLPPGTTIVSSGPLETRTGLVAFEAGSKVVFPGQDAEKSVPWGEGFRVQLPTSGALPADGPLTLPAGCQLHVAGSAWGTFTIACTIPIALLVSFYMYRFRKGRVVEASLLGAVGVVLATVVGGWVADSPLRAWFSLTREQTILALTTYGFVASVLPVWMLLCPRDYISSFLKIGTIGLLVVGLMAANPPLKAPMFNEVFMQGGPTFRDSPIFPFVFICIMCGAVSGFHSLVSSGTTPKMIDRESDVRMIGYGSMLMEGLVGVVALFAAASLDPVHHYYPINIPLDDAARWDAQLAEIDTKYGGDPLHITGVREPHKLPVGERDLAELEALVGGESLRGRTGGAVTLAVGMSVVLTDALHWTGLAVESFVKYWYHFAIMFEALFILTTIDTGTRIARFLLQETLAKAIPAFERPDWLPGALLSTLVVTVGWGALIWTGSISTIWPMFGIANQLLAVMALGLVTTLLVNQGKAKYAWVTLLPMLFVTATTMTAGAQLVGYQFPAKIAAGQHFLGWLNIGLTLFVMCSVGMLLLLAASRWIAVIAGMIPIRPDDLTQSLKGAHQSGDDPSS
jgi:carbon starvation protein